MAAAWGEMPAHRLDERRPYLRPVRAVGTDAWMVVDISTAEVLCVMTDFIARLEYIPESTVVTAKPQFISFIPDSHPPLIQNVPFMFATRKHAEFWSQAGTMEFMQRQTGKFLQFTNKLVEISGHATT